MAIFGAGSTWDKVEKKHDFFNDENYVIGWKYNQASDLYGVLSSLKAGDILYLKANQVGSKTIKVKGIGIIKKSFIHCIMDKFELNEAIKEEDIVLEVKWVFKAEFQVNIPGNDGKLTNVRAATLYEEYLPYVQNEILNKMLQNLVV